MKVYVGNRYVGEVRYVGDHVRQTDSDYMAYYPQALTNRNSNRALFSLHATEHGAIDALTDWDLEQGYHLSSVDTYA